MLNVEQSSIIRFTPTKFSHYPLNVVYADQPPTELDTLHFFGLQIDNHLIGKPHIDFLLHKLGTAYFVIIRLSNVLGTDSIETAYYSYFCSLIKYGIII
jgi:hypothetical protein